MRHQLDLTKMADLSNFFIGPADWKESSPRKKSHSYRSLLRKSARVIMVVKSFIFEVTKKVDHDIQFGKGGSMTKALTAHTLSIHKRC